MPILIVLVTTLVAFLTLYFLMSLRSKSKTTENTPKSDPSISFAGAQSDPHTSVPLLIFNSYKIEKTLTIDKGTTIVKNFYILEGQAEILHDNVRIGILRERQITHNAFDLLEIPCGITKRALTKMLVAELPECDVKQSRWRYLALKTFEKTCIEPALRLCQMHSLVAKMEVIKTQNFEEFILETFGVSNNKIDMMAAEGEVRLENCIYYVVSGSLIVNGVPFDRNSVFGYFGVFFNYYKGFKCTSTESTILKCMPYSRLRERTELKKSMLHNLPHTMILLGSTAEWRQMLYGDLIFVKDGKCDSVYLIEGVEYGCKECILGMRFSENLVAEKTTDVIRIPKMTIDVMIRSIPHFYEELTLKMFEKTPAESKIVLIRPTNPRSDVFVHRLGKILREGAIFLRNTHISEILGRNVFDTMGELILSEHLKGLREKYRVVIVWLENEYSRMLKMIYPYCDIIFLVGPEIINNCFYRANVEFVQLHDSRNRFKKVSKIKSALLWSLWGSNGSDSEEEDEMGIHIAPLAVAGTEGINKYRRVHHILSPREPNFCQKDYERFARYLLGERFGLVLGGGGARGYAHIGVIQALEEENVPVDVVGGTSMGAFVGALYARELDYVEVYSQAKRMSKRGASWFYILLDITLPLVSLFSGRSLDRGLKRIFGNQQIQNFWLEYFCITTNLVGMRESIHFNGPAFKYIRSSMSVVGLVPPVFYKGDLLCDGAYMNNLPIDVMASMGVKNIISVKVSRDFDNSAMCQYDSKSGVILFLKSLLLGRKYMTIADLQYRLSFLTSKELPPVPDTLDFLVMPDLAEYTGTDFHKFDEIVACGYEAAKKKIREWKTSGKLKEYKKKIRRYSI